MKSENGLSVLLEAVAARAKQHPTAFGHWYIDGGTPVDCSDGITCVSYKALESARTALLRKIQTQLDRPGMGPESLRTFLAQLRPADLGLGREAIRNQATKFFSDLRYAFSPKGPELKSSARYLPSGLRGRPCGALSRLPCSFDLRHVSGKSR